MSFDIFHHHDRVIHHQSDREHDRQQREQVQRETEHLHQEQGSDERNRNRHHWHDDRAEGAEEQKDHDHHDEQCVDQSFYDFVNRIVDVSGRVVSHVCLHPRRQFFFDLLHLDAHAFDHVDRVCVGQNPDAHEHRFFPGETNLGVVIFRAKLDISDVAYPDEVSFVLTNNELFEIIRRVQIGVGGEIDLKQRTFGVADGREIIVSRQRASYLGRAHVERGHAIRFHPNPHGEGAAAENIGALHAADRGQARLDQAHEIIGHLVRLENVGSETEIGGSDLRIGRLDFDDRNFRIPAADRAGWHRRASSRPTTPCSRRSSVSGER